MVDEDAIQREVFGRREAVNVGEEWYTPGGKRRSAPTYAATIRNGFLGKEKTIRAADRSTLEQKALTQLQAWAEDEVMRRVRSATRDAKEQARSNSADAEEDAKGTIAEIRGILAATLTVDDRINWASLLDTRRFPEFSFTLPQPQHPRPPSEPTPPSKPFWSWLMPSLVAKWQERCQALRAQQAATVQRLQREYQSGMTSWTQQCAAARQAYEVQNSALKTAQQQHNASVGGFRQRFEAGEPDDVEEYVRAVFERSSYPAAFRVTHSVAYDRASSTIVIDVELPPQRTVPDVVGYKFTAGPRNESKAVLMKPKEHDALYDEAIKQTIIRTIHEVFESVYVPCVQRVVANGWVTRVDPGTGHDVRGCIISVSASRFEFEALNLSRIEASECVRKLKGLTAGPLSQMGPVQPILQFNREDARFIEGRDVLDGLNSEQNLAEIPWEDFEHLVRELFGKMFSGKGAEVKVTQASHDQGVDAVAFDPDPIRGGKFVIQAKRYTRVVSVSAVRELYGTMINEGASKGILVTTANYGPDSREFAKDKPITLIDGSNLVYLLEEHGYRVRLDVAAARAKRANT